MQPKNKKYPQYMPFGIILNYEITVDSILTVYQYLCRCSVVFFILKMPAARLKKPE
jgi:hypothetical protein